MVAPKCDGRWMTKSHFRFSAEGPATTWNIPSKSKGQAQMAGQEPEGTCVSVNTAVKAGACPVIRGQKGWRYILLLISQYLRQLKRSSDPWNIFSLFYITRHYPSLHLSFSIKQGEEQMVPLQASLCPLVAESLLVELLSRGKLFTPSTEESSGIWACQIAPAPGRDVGGGMKARSAEAFLRFLSTFSIQLANSHFHAKYGVLPTAAAARPCPGLAASCPPPAPSHKLAQGLTSKHKTFFTCPRMPTLPGPSNLF